LFILEYFEICFYFHGHQKGAHLLQRGATEVLGGQLPQTPPLDPPLTCNYPVPPKISVGCGPVENIENRDSIHDAA